MALVCCCETIHTTRRSALHTRHGQRSPHRKRVYDKRSFSFRARSHVNGEARGRGERGRSTPRSSADTWHEAYLFFIGRLWVCGPCGAVSSLHEERVPPPRAGLKGVGTAIVSDKWHSIRVVVKPAVLATLRSRKTPFETWWDRVSANRGPLGRQQWSSDRPC